MNKNKYKKNEIKKGRMNTVVPGSILKPSLASLIILILLKLEASVIAKTISWEDKSFKTPEYNSI